MAAADPDISRTRLIPDGTFLEEDRREIGRRRRGHNRSGFAYQIAFVRVLGRLSAKTVIDATLASHDATSGARLFQLSKAFRRIIGAHLFGFTDTGARYNNPHDETPANREPAVSFVNLIGRLIGWISRDAPESGTPHEFELTTLICRPNPAHSPSHRTADNVWCWLRKYPAPVAVNTGRTVAHDTTVTLIGDNDVRVYADDATKTLHNVTEEGHVFHNPAQTGCPHPPGTPPQPVSTRCGQTRREVLVFEDGTIAIRTTGQGSGPYPALNEAFGPFVFRAIVDHDLRSRAMPRAPSAPNAAISAIPDALNAAILQCTND